MTTRKTIDTLTDDPEVVRDNMMTYLGLMTTEEYMEKHTPALLKAYRDASFTLDEALADGEAKGADPEALIYFREAWAATDAEDDDA